MSQDGKSLNERLSGLSSDQLRALLRKGRDASAPRIGKPAKMERNSEGIYPLSKAQERMWFLHNLNEGLALYNNPVALRISAEFPLNIDTLSRSLALLTERHEILRTTFRVMDGKPVQVVHPMGNSEIKYVDLRALPMHERELEAMAEAVEQGKTSIPLDHLPLLRFKVLHLGDFEYILLINPHHIISDGWSNALFAKELSMTYAALEDKEAPPFPVPEYQYIDFVKWEKEWMESPAYKDQLDFWQEQMKDLPDPLRLPLDFQRPAVMSHIGSKEVSCLDESESEKLRQFCQRENLTLFHLLFGCFGLLMSKYSGQDDIMIGVPVARRNQMAFQQTMGLFINTLPLRVKMNDSGKAIEYLREVKTHSQEAFLRQEMPFEKLIEEVNPNRNLGTNPVFQVHFVHQNIPSLYSVKGLSVKPESIDYSFSKFDLNFWVEEANRELIISVTYPRDIFQAKTIRKMLVNFRILLDSLTSHPDMPIGRLAYFPENERSLSRGDTLVYAGQSSTLPATWLGEFKACVARNPGFFALRDIYQRLTYLDVDLISDLVSQHLAQQGVKKGDMVGMLLPRDASMIISILGIFKSGAAYVPLDVILPAERLKFIAADAGLKLIITTEKLSDKAMETEIPVLLYKMLVAAWDDHGQVKTADANASLPEPGLPGPGDPAYVIYTSGTTGNPKGVCIESDQLLNYSKAVWNRMKLKEGDSFATISSIAADLGNTMIFPPLIHGGEVVVIPEDLSTDATLLAEWFGKQPVDCLKIVPSHLLSLLHSSRAGDILPRQLLVLGGEKCSAETVRQVRSIAPELRIVNHYGPTEATIGSLTWEIPFNPDPRQTSFPIGLPLDNTAVWIEGNDLQVLPKGVPGEIILSGRNIARGYLNQPQLTGEKFRVDPHLPGQRIYRTGDVGRMDDDGTVMFLGRKDHQVKIRGYRVELREIEHVMNAFRSVEQSVVLVPEHDAAVTFVEAAIILKPGFEYDENALRQWISSHLPSYMIPAAFHVVGSFPLTANGKMDIKKLNGMITKKEEIVKSSALPRDLTELRLVNIFREVLQRENMGIEDGFFDLGGHSLLAIQLFAAIEKEFGVHLPLATLFERGNVLKLAELLRGSGIVQKTSSLVPIRPGTGRKVMYLVHPAGGNVLCYYELARELSAEYSVYGLQANGLHGKKVDTIGDMAHFYLEEISLPASLDDLVFAGWSMGALVAFEMARQVGERFGQNPRLMIIDQVAPGVETGRMKNTGIDPVDRMLVFAGKVAHLVGRPLGINAADLRGKSQEEQSGVFLKAFKEVNLVPPDMTTGDFHGYLDMMIHHNEITSACLPGTFRGKTLLIRAEDAFPPLDDQHTIPSRTADLDWGKWIEHDLSVVTIPGNHVSVIARPYVQKMAAELMKWVNQGK